jgi:hypothetical protein
MLKAASIDRDRFPSLFQLSLQILSGGRPLPSQLSSHLRRVVTEAVQIAADPSAITKDTLPAAIQLALDIRRSVDVRNVVDQTPDGGITPQGARDILTAERRLAAAG